jgi:hypothetical protein
MQHNQLRYLLFFALFIGCGHPESTASLESGGESFPKHPDSGLTPGELCRTSNARRYPERIKYCERNVSTDTKAYIMRLYDSTLGFATQQMPRSEFKIDHYIPLCAGGSNDAKNLWPQHRSIYVQTDQIEGVLCEVMAAGRILQRDAVVLVKDVKAHPETAERRAQELRDLL